jgi:hypothetical protein
METIFVSIVSVALVLISSITMTASSIRSTNKLADSIKQMETRTLEIRRTDISAAPPDSYTGGLINLIIGNEGQAILSDFSNWDVIVQFQDGGVVYLLYSEVNPPVNNQWTVTDIFLPGGLPEVFDTGILDPGEQMTLSILLDPEIEVGKTCRVTVSTPNGIKAQVQVTRKS